MGILISDTQHWQAANWIMRTFMRDLLQASSLPDELQSELESTLNASLYTLDLRSRSVEARASFLEAVRWVLAGSRQQRSVDNVDSGSLCAYIAKLEELVAILEGEPPRATRLPVKTPITIRFQLGSEWAPDWDSGFDELDIEQDGVFTYTNRRRGKIRTVHGRMSLRAIDTIIDTLSRAGFPAVPKHAIPPGGSVFSIALQDASGADSAIMSFYTASHFLGYSDVVNLVERWLDVLRSGMPDPDDQDILEVRE